MMSSTHWSNFGQSASGKPQRRLKTIVTTGRAKSREASATSCAAIAAASSCAVCRMPGVSTSSIRGVNSGSRIFR